MISYNDPTVWRDRVMVIMIYRLLPWQYFKFACQWHRQCDVRFVYSMAFSLYRSYLRQIRLLPHLYLRCAVQIFNQKLSEHSTANSSRSKQEMTFKLFWQPKILNFVLVELPLYWRSDIVIIRAFITLPIDGKVSKIGWQSEHGWNQSFWSRSGSSLW